MGGYTTVFGPSRLVADSGELLDQEDLMSKHFNVLVLVGSVLSA